MKRTEDVPVKVEEPDFSGTYTARDYLNWQLDELVELIRGKIYKMSPSPTSNHQRISIGLGSVFFHFFQNKKCEAFVAPFDVYLVNPGQDYKESENILEPDLCVICDPEKVRKFGCVGAPDLVVEILSPSTSKKDREIKFGLYEEFGVREYWIIYPEKRTVTVNVLESGKFQTLPVASGTEKLSSRIFPELKVDLQEVFKKLR